MLIEETLFGTVDKVKDSIERLKAFEPKDKPYWLAFSGGKDSVVILALAKMAGVNFEAVYNVTSVDPPELVRFIKTKYPEVRIEIPHDKNGKSVTMWSLITNNSLPPTQLFRYCCRHLKESSGKGTVTITGVRWAESVNRKKNQGLAIVQNGTKKDGIILNDDNDESRRTVESCYRTHKTLVNPIIDWEDEDVWEFIHKYNIPYCELYDQGWERLGCIGCPMSGSKRMQEQLNKYPKYKAQYLRCFDKMLLRRAQRGIENRFNWKSAEDVYNWWVRADSNCDSNADMVGLFDDEYEEGEES